MDPAHKQRIMEAALRRIAASPLRDRLVLRGGLLTRLWVGPTRKADDLDFLGLPPLTHDAAAAPLRAALAADARDGVTFDVDHLSAEFIWADTDSPGLRMTVGSLQIDVGFGDPMDPPPEALDYPTPLGPVSVLAARPETALAWKVHGLFELRDGRWRPKDLHDILLIARHTDIHFGPDAAPLARALRLAFSSRDTPLVAARRLLDGDFGRSRGARVGWRGFRKARPELNLPEDCAPLVAEAAALLRPVFERLFNEDREATGMISAAAPTGPASLSGRFPAIRHINDVMPAIAGRPEFAIYRRGPLTAITYERSLKDTFPDPAEAPDPATARLWAIRRECRGLTFAPDGRLVARKLHKFFNVDERAESRADALPAGGRVLEKLDGSMLTPVVLDGEVLWTTRRGPSDISERAAAHAARHPGRYRELAMDRAEAGFTVIFEWCSRSHRLVLDYPEDQLVLLAARRTVEGDYMDHGALLDLGGRYGVPVIQSLGPAPTPLASLVDEVREARDIEGVVLCYPDGRRAKLKSRHFRRLHEVVEHLDRERPLWRLLIRGEVDDLLPALSPADRERVADYADRLERALAAREAWLAALVAPARAALAGRAPSDARRAFVLSHLQGLSQDERALALRVWNGQLVGEATRAYVAERLRTPKSLARIRALLDMPPWGARRGS